MQAYYELQTYENTLAEGFHDPKGLYKH
ncbi:hypothetical protein RV134_270355 [Roseovarius sp. EC-HK134]|nr:hypothetical protein RV134_270355 [Roseovarius sp. EC-HK134]VVT16786.1 hypothetical protein RV420_330081 [Roseovarius sp. EC-SD190]